MFTITVSTSDWQVGSRPQFPVRGDYVERYWLPIFGPSAIVVARQLGHLPHDVPHDVELDRLAGSVGLWKKEKLFDIFARLTHYSLAYWNVEGFDWVMAAQWPELPVRLKGRLPEDLRITHDAEMRELAAS